jgi:hypothetical protein
METPTLDIIEDSVERKLCQRCGLPLIPVPYGWLTLYRHNDPDECDRTYGAEHGIDVGRER